MPRSTYDPWTDPRYTRKFTAKVTILYMRREDMAAQVKEGKIPATEFYKYWPKRGGPQHLEELSIEADPDDWRELLKWFKTWRHKGGGYYDAGNGNGYAVRAGGVNQHKDPLNVFFLERE